jgi:glycosyltransferase involved in cell wall biosynthesis
MKIHVLIPSYNCGNWIDRCLWSVAAQHRKPDQVLVIDDASTELGYEQRLSRTCKGLGFMFHRNPANMKCPYNLRLGIRLLAPEPDDVIFLLDGDDFVPPHAIRRIGEVYEDPDVWLTYGNYEPTPHNTGQIRAYAYPPDVIANRSFRISDNCFNHPLTFRKFLWDGVTDADMQSSHGHWFTGGYDKVIMSPMLEMSAPDHFRFLDETLYFYNAVNPTSESEIHVPRVEESREMMWRPMKPQMVRPC